ncbi:DNA cytosine methyltransferase [Ralstonia solanacearum]|uniref:DNA cytosine methyltransferase n=1 Tax=Ralstonia solanacearum TaxID=305 RepID=UPI0005C5CFA5|nr:DNA cytosine methyltransferase [Ralstonia solanacearum]MBB6591001.1 DNA cytosine methyltransferase [Ralstonia solanacearum]MBB6595196.1 DNA cytosine methyltransferase [Ralstonia solanacearum]MDB0541060.1 DNA cytosine methyltransferase [Ralstonia solanacearum]MDB0554147.1 DNA cytosine methyltransferase [Ralstonia solanacearum]MDB0555944.1 DNA cytosine methyltransferase [Ralstonia solanacearum]
MYANPDPQRNTGNPTVGSLFAGIGGFDLGFERAGFRTAWQVEIDPIRRAVLADRFPHAQRFDDVRACGRHNLSAVDVIVGGFPCQDLSTMGKRAGLAGERSGLFYEVVRIINELRPRWLVLENVTGLLSCNDGEDFAAVIGTLAECGYLGFWRVLNAQYFGVPTKRRRVFMVAGLGCHPPFDLLADAGPVDELPRTQVEEQKQDRIDLARWAYPTILAGKATSQICISGSGLVAVEDGWGAMAERSRALEHHGLCKGLDEANFAEAQGAGNAVCPPVAEWVARHLVGACA